MRRGREASDLDYVLSRKECDMTASCTIISSSPLRTRPYLITIIVAVAEDHCTILERRQRGRTYIGGFLSTRIIAIPRVTFLGSSSTFLPSSLERFRIQHHAMRDT
ncbi:hypothetical protein Tco_1234673 [Tanacetum coccineum]